MIELGKTYRTRDGCEVRIYAVDTGESRGGDGPVHGTYQASGGWYIGSWHHDGRYLIDREHGNDLIEVKPKITRTVWVVRYRIGHSTNRPDHVTGVEFDHCAEAHRFANSTIGDVIAVTGPHEITFTEGEGL